MNELLPLLEKISSASGIMPSRRKILRSGSIRREASSVLYWMQASQRAETNHALEDAINAADILKKPLTVLFCLYNAYPEAQKSHYDFMLEGLSETASTLSRRGINFILEKGNPSEIIPAKQDYALIFTDCGYTKIQKCWRETISKNLTVPMIQLESDIIVPVEEASGKEEFAARTLRPKIHRKLEEYLIPLKEKNPQIKSSADHKLPELKAGLQFRGGAKNAMERLKLFIQAKLKSYQDDRNHPELDGTSQLSPYLHFGQISPLTVALEIRKNPSESAEAFLEELTVRRELAINFVHYNKNYDSYSSLPDWALKTLEKHSGDKRQWIYTREEFEVAGTHDDAWNSAQVQMMRDGWMSSYMRMYWGKKILEWSRTPEEAFETALYLNNKYELDGRDPNGYAGVAWCFGKHDRPWGEREIFGTVRFMSYNGLKGKFDLQAYIEKNKS